MGSLAQLPYVPGYLDYCQQMPSDTIKIFGYPLQRLRQGHADKNGRRRAPRRRMSQWKCLDNDDIVRVSVAQGKELTEDEERELKHRTNQLVKIANERR